MSILWEYLEKGGEEWKKRGAVLNMGSLQKSIKRNRGFGVFFFFSYGSNKWKKHRAHFVCSSCWAQRAYFLTGRTILYNPAELVGANLHHNFIRCATGQIYFVQFWCKNIKHIQFYSQSEACITQYLPLLFPWVRKLVFKARASWARWVTTLIES